VRSMSPKVMRVSAMAVFFAVGIPGMIVASINDNSGAAVTFGLIGVGAALALLAATAVTTPRLPPQAMGRTEALAVDEAEAEALEAQIQTLVSSGVDEGAVRDLVRRAVHMARRSPA